MKLNREFLDGKYVSLRTHLTESASELKIDEDDQYETLGALFLLLHQSTHPITYYESSKGRFEAVFERAWLKRCTPLITNDPQLRAQFTHEYLYSGCGVFGRLRGPLRVTVEEWKRESDGLGGTRLSKKAVTVAAEQAQKALGTPAYRRAIICRKSGGIEQEAEWPSWLLDSLDFCAIG